MSHYALNILILKHLNLVDDHRRDLKWTKSAVNIPMNGLLSPPDHLDRKYLKEPDYRKNIL